MEFVPYDEFEDIKFIAKGGFSEVYKAKWPRGPVINYKSGFRDNNCLVVLKKLDNSKHITSKELNEVYCYCINVLILCSNISLICL